jgi:hypothetical protein
MPTYLQLTEQQGNEMLLFLSTSTPPPPTWWFWPTAGWNTLPSLSKLTSVGIKQRQTEFRTILLQKGYLVKDGWRFCWYDPSTRVQWLMRQIESLSLNDRLALFAQIGATYGQIHP